MDLRLRDHVVERKRPRDPSKSPLDPTGGLASPAATLGSPVGERYVEAVEKPKSTLTD